MDEFGSELKINAELRRLVPPLAQFYKDSMIEELCIRGETRGIHTWRNTILVDYEYYECCLTLQIPYRTIPVSISCYEEAIIWICKNQLTRKDIPEEMRKYLLGKRSITEATLGAHKMAQLGQRKIKNIKDTSSVVKYESTHTGTRQRLGKEYGMSFGTIRKYELYTQMLDRLYVYFPNEIDGVLKGDYKLSMLKLEKLASLPDSEIKTIFPLILSGDDHSIGKQFFQNKSDLQSIPVATPAFSIKDMPAYDPDAEISSLALTIPSWASSIRRVTNTVDVSTTSPEARKKLRQALNDLKLTSDEILYLIRRSTNGQV